jgi:hydroxyacylglutathione hydrolase
VEITTGIHRIDGVRGVNCYLVITETQMLLIDTGFPGNGKRIIDYVKGLGKNPSHIDYVILTHADIDHIGSAAEIKQMTDAKLVIHAGDALVLSGKSEFKTIKGPPGMLVKLLYSLLRFHPVEADVILKEDSGMEGFQVIHTPGHTNGSISLYLPGRAVFVGDALRSDFRGNPYPVRRGIFSLDLTQAKASVMAISELEFDILLPGHGAPLIGKASSKLKDLVERLELDTEVPSIK